MLKKVYRLSSSDMREVLTHKSFVVSTSFFMAFILYKKTNLEFESKFAVTITKKLHKSAVDRHRAKRRIMQILRSVREQFPKNMYISILLRRDIRATSFEKLTDEISVLLEKINIKIGKS